MKLNLSIEEWINLMAEQADLGNHAFWVSNLDYKNHIFIHPNFKSIWGVSPETMYNHNEYFGSRLLTIPRKLFRSNSVKRHKNKETGQGTIFYTIKSEDGQEKFIRDRYTTLYDTYGNPIAASGFAEDISAKKDELNSNYDEAYNITQEIIQDRLNLLTTPASHAPRLTERERQCAQYLVQGKTAKETAELMCRSRRTIEKHIDNLKIKLNCSRKTELVKTLLHLNIVNPS